MVYLDDGYVYVVVWGEGIFVIDVCICVIILVLMLDVFDVGIVLVFVMYDGDLWYVSVVGLMWLDCECYCMVFVEGVL